jgi:hypothetical protein
MKGLKKGTTILLISMIASFSGLAQAPARAVKFARIYEFSGEMKALFYHRDQLRKGLSFDERQRSLSVAPSLLLRTKNYFWHPRFLCVDVEGQYSPIKASEKYLVVPDQSETRDMKKIDVRAHLLPQYKVSMSSYFNYTQLVSLRENLSNIRSEGTVWGNTVFLRSKLLPLNFNISGRNEDEKEVQSGRRFIGRQQNMELSTNSSSSKWYKHTISLAHNDYYRKDFTFYEVNNRINSMNYSNQLLFSQKKAISLNGFFSGVKQTGSDTFTRYQASEYFSLQLLKNLQLRSGYNYFSDRRPAHILQQQRIGGSLHHQLYESLQTELMYEFNESKNTAFSQNLRSTSLNMNYTKKFLRVNQVDLSYRKMISQQQWYGNDQVLMVLNEQVRLKDGEITLLIRQGADPSTVVVKNNAGNIIYRPNFDYLIIQQNNFLQIQRVRGGQIANDDIVFVDYQAVQPGNYSYTSNSYQLHGGISFFDRKFNMYFRRAVQGYDHLSKTEFLTLNYFDQWVYGLKVDFRFLSAGAEYDNNIKNTVLPYTLYRYFLHAQGTVLGRLSVFANGNYNHYPQLGREKNIHFMDLSGSVNYPFSRKASVSGAVSYMKQDGDKVNLDLLTCRARFDWLFHKIRGSLIYNFYDRKVFKEQIRSHAMNIELVRRF